MRSLLLVLLLTSPLLAEELDFDVMRHAVHEPMVEEPPPIPKKKTLRDMVRSAQDGKVFIVSAGQGGSTNQKWKNICQGRGWKFVTVKPGSMANEHNPDGWEVGVHQCMVEDGKLWFANEEPPRNTIKCHVPLEEYVEYTEPHVVNEYVQPQRIYQQRSQPRSFQSPPARRYSPPVMSAQGCAGST